MAFLSVFYFYLQTACMYCTYDTSLPTIRKPLSRTQMHLYYYAHDSSILGKLYRDKCQFPVMSASAVDSYHVWWCLMEGTDRRFE